MVNQYELYLPEYKRGYHLITRLIEEHLTELPEKAMLNIFIHHTSASLTINENADSTVRLDFENIFNKLIPENATFYKHNSEGSDDLPAHIKSSIIGQSLIIPISNHKMKLGIWQGIYLCEFRNNGGKRKITLTVIC